jgi:hypothetical protein
MDVEAIAALRMRPEVEREVERGMREFLAYSLDRSPRSLAFLDEIRRPGQERGRSAVSRTLGRADAAVVAASGGVGSSEPVEGLAPA